MAVVGVFLTHEQSRSRRPRISAARAGVQRVQQRREALAYSRYKPKSKGAPLTKALNIRRRHKAKSAASLYGQDRVGPW